MLVDHLTSFADVEPIVAEGDEKIEEVERVVDPVVVDILLRNRGSREQAVGETTINILAQRDLSMVEGGEEPINQEIVEECLEQPSRDARDLKEEETSELGETIETTPFHPKKSRRTENQTREARRLVHLKAIGSLCVATSRLMAKRERKKRLENHFDECTERQL